MKTSKQQQGFAAVEAILLVIVLGIIGFTGWFVYHSKQTTDKALATTADTASPTTKKPPEIPTTKQADVDGVLSFKYPTAWSLAQTPQPTYLSQTNGNSGDVVHNTTVQSPSGDVSVQIKGGIGGVGGACLPGDAGNIDDVSVFDIAAQPGYKVVVYHTDNQAYLAAVMEAKTAAKAKVGADACDVAFGPLLDGYLKGIGQILIRSKELDAAENKTPKVGKVLYGNVVEGAEFQAAIKIVQTLTHE